MVAFRIVNSAAVAEQVVETIKLHESRCWTNCLLLGIDPRTFKMDYEVPAPVDDEEQDGENSLYDFQERARNGYALAGRSDFAFGDCLDHDTKVYATEFAIEALEALLLERCVEHGLDPADIDEGWSSGDLGLVDVEGYNEKLHMAYSVMDSLNA